MKNDWKNIFFAFFVLLCVGLCWGQLTISTSVTSSADYQSTFVGTGNSVDTNTKTITVDGALTLNNGANLVLEEGWILNADDFIINTGIDSSKPADIEDLSNYTFAMKQGSRLNITATSNSNKIRSGRVYVDNGTVTYTPSLGQYHFGSYAPNHNTFYYIKYISLLSNGDGRLLLQFNRATGDAIFEGAGFFGVGKTEFNSIWGIDTYNIKVQAQYATSIGIEYNLGNSDDKIGGEDGNNWTYFRDWIFEDYSVVNAPNFAPRSNVNVAFIDPDLQGSQVIRLLRNVGGSNTNGAWIDIRRSFTPKFVDTESNPLEGVKLLIASDASEFRWFEGGGRTTGTGVKLGRFIKDYNNVSSAVSGEDGYLNNTEKRAYYRVGHRESSDGTGDVHIYTQTPTAYFFKYAKQIGVLILNNDTKIELDIVLIDDSNISQTDKNTVDAYTEIETLDKLYDRSSSWKVDNVADEFPTISSQLITVTGTTLDLGNLNLVIDATATDAFAVNTTTNTITIKASTLAVGSKFYSIITSGTITAQNSAAVDFGYEDTNGKNIYVDFNWGTNDAYDIKFTNLNDQSYISGSGTTTNVTQSYSGIITAPSPFGSGIKIEVYDTGTDSSSADRFYFTTNITDENALSFSLDSNDINADPTGAAQHEALFLARKILQKTESMAAVLEGTTPSLTSDGTSTTSGTDATKENQEAIKNLLLRILTKTTTSHEALKGAN